MKNNIVSLLDKRDSFLKLYDEQYNILTGKYNIDEPLEIDILKNQIIDLIFENNKILDIDFIVESLTKVGLSPNILHDDNGNFAIEGSGFQTLAIGDLPSDIEISFFVNKNSWKPTIREAMYYYLNDMKNN